ncbi:MAG: response regulator [Gammaproteobacteria bacterium]|nr:response regulator [Gammaproteobacteria bacterium]
MEDAPVSALSLDRMLQHIHALFRPALIHKQLTCVIRANTLTFPATLHAPFSLIETVCIHLLSNAIEYTPVHGHIIIEYDYRAPSPPTHSQPLCQIKVIDTGIGISIVDQKKIFEAFKRLTPSYKINHATGIGLGLYNCKKIADVLQGNLSVTSQGAGQGSVFCFTFPVSLDTIQTTMADSSLSASKIVTDNVTSIVDTPSIAMTKSTTHSSPQKKTTSHLLIVEDVKMIRDMTKKLFQNLSNSCHIDIAENMSTALVRAETKRYDLILMDIGLPDGCGIDASRIIHSQSNSHCKNHHTPIIAVTAHIDSETEKIACQRAGIITIIEKPLTQMKAQALYRDYLEKNTCHQA